MKRLYAAACAFVLAAGGAILPAVADEVAPERLPHGLVLEKRGDFKYTWSHPDVDFSQYDKVLIVDGEVEYRDVGEAQRSRSRALMANERFFGISEKDRQRFEDIAAEAFVKQLANYSKKFEIVEAPGPNTLIIRAHLKDVVSSVPPPFIGAGEVYSNSVGEATVVFELYDGVTAQPLALAMERRKIQGILGGSIDTMYASNGVNAWAEVTRWAGRIGARVASSLNNMHGI